MKSLILLLSLWLGVSITAMAESECPSGYDYVINSFKAKKPQFRESERANINHIADQVIAKLDTLERLDVYGHSATWGNIDLQALSEQRAEYVLDEIVAEVENRIGKEVEFYIYYWGFADDCPIATNETQTGRTSNRRVQVKLTEAQPEENWCELGERVKKAPTGRIAKNKLERARLKYLRNFLGQALCEGDFDGRYQRFYARDGYGRQVNTCGTEKQILSAEKWGKPVKAIRKFKRKIKPSMTNKQLARQVQKIADGITCEINKVFSALFSTTGDAPGTEQREECGLLNEMTAASKQSSPISIYTAWHTRMARAAKRHCEG